MTATTSPCETIAELLDAAIHRGGDRPALGAIVGGQLTWRSWRELGTLVEAWQGVLEALGVRPADRVAQISSNCQEWILIDLAIQRLGAVHVPLHASLAASQAAEHARHAEAGLIVCRDAAMAEALGKHGGAGLVVSHAQIAASIPPFPLESGSGCETPPGSVDPAHCPGERQPEPDDLATILYTSGTTGAPLGVMLSQRNLVSNAIAITEAAAPSGDEIRLCVLPLSHIYARTCDLYSWLVHGGRLVLAESRETIFRDCTIAAPTAINGVPYFYQKVVDRVRSAAAADPSAVTGADLPSDAPPDLGVTAGGLRAALGGAVKRLYCGGAPLAPEVDRRFAEAGLPILCGYGLTEASPVISATAPGGYRPGTVGPPIAGIEIQLAEDGELLVRGPGVMQGYWRDEPATARVLVDGWLHTGDLAEWDADGNLRIVGRKKELIVLSTGKKVAPTWIEALLMGSPWIEQACVVGDGRKCLTALVVPNGDALRGEIRRRRLWVWSPRRAVKHPQVAALYREEIARCLAGAAQYEQIAAFTLLDRAFDQQLGEVTPKLSLCRRVIERGFARQIEAMYARLNYK